MTRMIVVVASATGRTQLLADGFAEGARAAGAEVEVVAAESADTSQLEQADAIVLGSGVHMGGIKSAMRVFLERTAPLWLQGRLAGKLGAAFVSSGAGGRGGGELALISLHAALAEHGLLLVPMTNRSEGFAAGGSHWGPLAWTNPRSGKPGPTEQHIAAARAHGSHVAECSARWLRGARE
jgi:NAD(P)H dehydrogenase (quinone)